MIPTYDALKFTVNMYCQRFLKNTMYGECKAFCPFHIINNNNELPMCSDKFIKENPERVTEILKKEGIKIGH